MTAGWQKVEQDMRDNGFLRLRLVFTWMIAVFCVLLWLLQMLRWLTGITGASLWGSVKTSRKFRQQQKVARSVLRWPRLIPEWFKEEVHILGCSTTSTGRRKNTQQEIDRLKKAKARAFLIDCARPNFANLGWSHSSTGGAVMLLWLDQQEAY